MAGESLDALLELLERARPPVAAAGPPITADRFDATLLWMAESPLLPGRDYLMCVAGDMVIATVAPLRYKIDIDAGKHIAADKLYRNEVGSCQLELDSAI